MEKSTLRDIRALIFDMDGVIVDSEPLHLLAYQEYFRTHNLEYTAEHNSEFLGTKDVWMAQVLIDRHKLPETPQGMVKAKETILMRLLTEEAKPRPGLHDILTKAKLAELPMGIASSATLPTINLVVDRLNIREYFQTLTSGDEVQNGKPAPDVFLLAAKRVGVDPRHCLVIEDTLNGIKAAKSAGMICIAIPCAETMHQDHSLADVRLQSLEQVNFEKDSAGVLSVTPSPVRADR
jgi:beta-phosphoglucomutase family hydrolase